MEKKALQDGLDGTHTRLLIRVQNISWREHQTKSEICGDMPPIYSTVACRRTCFAGHCFHAKDQIIFHVISLRLPCPTRGRRPLNYIDCIARDIETLMTLIYLARHCCALSRMRPPCSRSSVGYIEHFEL